ncbi:UNVERIFIED_CONTAM: putative ribonuclease H protein [Sesamum latifolium]|uniref:Ribonuclease H protein n=1 Tax=Sesamum latifolium TaxID=2727402 RepID=A0AAW2WWN6_9LAMI
MTPKNWQGDLSTASRLGFEFERRSPQLPKKVSWSPPTDDWFKLNCNSASKGNPGPASSGGLLRDMRGRLVFPFYECLDSYTNTFTELYAVVQGLEIAHEQGIQLVWVEIDTQSVLHIIQRAAGHWKLQGLLTRLRILKAFVNQIFSCLQRREPSGGLSR